MAPSTPTPTTTPAYTNTVFAPAGPSPMMSPIMPTAGPPPGSMGPPPAKSQEKPQEKNDYDFTDILAGTGIDMSQEERIAADLSGATLFEHAARTGFPQLEPSGKSSFYGAGPASHPADSAADISQKHFEYERATRNWDDRASKLQSKRAHELNEPFTNVHRLHARMEKIAGENGLGLSLATKEKDKDGKEKQVTTQQQGRLPPDVACAPSIKVTTKPAEDGGTTAVYDSFVPFESYLADQLALISIAAKAHVRGLLEESFRVSKHRQHTTHAVPEDWKDVAAPVPGIDDNMRSTPSESTVPAKRTASEAKLPNEIISSLRDIVKQDRSVEEKRLLRRQKRQKGNSAAPSRAGSVAPGTPGSVAPEPEAKPMTKKEMKKQQKLAEQSSAANVNSTTSHFLFGRKDKKKKKYSWMTSGASTPTTPRASVGGGPAGGAPGTPGPSTPAAPASLTTNGRYRHGAFREDGLVGKTIQMRDLIATLEKSDTAPIEALQMAYDRLDGVGVGSKPSG